MLPSKRPHRRSGVGLGIGSVWDIGSRLEQAGRLTPPAPRASVGIHEHRRVHGGVAASTIARDVEELQGFLSFLRRRRRSPAQVRLTDVDAYVVARGETLSRRTIARTCCAIRAFLRFLHATGRMPLALAPFVVAPRCRASERPPRALPWANVKAILRAIDRRTRVGRRDHALLLAMATYGLGAAEALGLRLEDLEWSARLLRVRRPKTGQEVVLPLLPEVGRALATYIQRGRASHSKTRAVFLRLRAPHQALTSGAVRHIGRKYASRAGVTRTHLGAHVLRHSHATRQVELGAQLKIVGDILGHRSPSSTSIYVRVATERLRELSLPVPQ